MWPYWAMFLPPALAAFLENRPASNVTRLRAISPDLAWLFVLLLMVLMIGYRFNVGGDWFGYLDILANVRNSDFAEVLTQSDPGYMLVNWLSVQLDWGVYGTNLICGAIFVFGLGGFCRRQPRPWLALTVAIPYIVIVVAMGYTRQGVAVALAMLGLVALRDRSTVRFVAWIALAATFHKSAVLLLPLAALAAARNRYWKAAWVGVIGLVLYGLLLEPDVEALYGNYVTAQYESQGALVRLLMNALPAVVFLIFRRRFQFSESEVRLWTWFAIFSLVALGLFFATPASTAVDRVALYLLPLQLVVFAHLPDAFGTDRKREKAPKGAVLPFFRAGGRTTGKDAKRLTVVILLYYAAVEFVWLNFAANAPEWVPYRFYLLESSF